MRTLWQDLRYGVRMMLKTPGFTLVAVASIALGIGANTAIFSVVNAMLLRPLPVAEPGRLVYVFSGTEQEPYSVTSYPDYVDYRDGSEVFEGLAAYSGITVSLTGGEQAETVSGTIATGNYFPVLGVRPALGRLLTPDDDRQPGAHPVAVLGHGFWQRRFGGDPGAVGRTLLINGQQFTVVGVAPAEFTGANPGDSSDIWVPMMMQPVVRPPRGGYSGEMNPDLLARRSAGWLDIVGRLRPGVTPEQAQAAVSTLARRLEQAYPDTNREQTAAVSPVSQGDPTRRGTLVSVAGLMTAVVGLVLLIACANVANLLLVRASARRKEISVRLALGASRRRLVRQLLTESTLLALVGGAAGLLLAAWTVDALKGFEPPSSVFPFAFDYSLDARVLGFTLLLSLLTGLVFGLAPALQASRPDLVVALKGETPTAEFARRRFGLRQLLVVAQVALSLVLLIGAGLFIRSLREAQAINPGFDPENVLVTPLSINLLRYTSAQGREFYRQTVERAEALPGVESASLARVLPLSGGSRRSSLLVEGQTGTGEASRSEGTGSESVGRNEVFANVVGLKYFQTMRIGLAAGRDFTAQDREGAPAVAVVNETFARRHFAGQDPLGRRISLSGPKGPWREVVGVARDSKYRTLGEPAAPFVYLPLLQNHETGMTLLVRTKGDPAGTAAGVRGAVRSLEPNLPVTEVQPMTQVLGRSLFPARAGATLLAVFGALALVLASVGLYGVMAYSVSRRSREIGVRMALGAQRGDVLRLVLGEGARLVAAGIVLGVAAALAASRLLTSFLYGVSTTDPPTFFVIALLLASVALLACYVPARRATKVDPMTALRYE